MALSPNDSIVPTSADRASADAAEQRIDVVLKQGARGREVAFRFADLGEPVPGFVAVEVLAERYRQAKPSGWHVYVDHAAATFTLSRP